MHLSLARVSICALRPLPLVSWLALFIVACAGGPISDFPTANNPDDNGAEHADAGSTPTGDGDGDGDGDSEHAGPLDAGLSGERDLDAGVDASSDAGVDASDGAGLDDAAADDAGSPTDAGEADADAPG